MNNLYKLSTEANPDKVFLVNRSELEGRMDTNIILYNRRINNFLYPIVALKNLLLSSPQYGANEPSIARNRIEDPRYIRITDIDEYGLLNNELGATSEVIESKYYLHDNDFLFARSGATVGKTYLHIDSQVNYKCFFAGYMIRFVVDSKKILPKFLFAYTQLKPYKDWVKAIQRTAAQPNINAEEYKSLQIPLPPLSVQQQIVDLYQEAYDRKQQKEAEAKALLDSIDDYLLGELGITLSEKDNNLEKRVFTTQFCEVAGGRLDANFFLSEFKEIEKSIKQSVYPSIKLKDLFQINRGGSPRPINDFFTTEDNGLNWIKIGDTKENDLYINSTTQKIISEGAKYSRMVEVGDFLLSNSMSFGRPYISNIIGYIHDGWLLFKPRDIAVDKIFMHTLLGSKLIYKLFGKATIGGVVENLNIDLVKQIQIPLPPLDKQNEIAEHIQGIRERAKQLQEEAKTLLDEAKQQVEQMILG